MTPYEQLVEAINNDLDLDDHTKKTSIALIAAFADAVKDIKRIADVLERPRSQPMPSVMNITGEFSKWHMHDGSPTAPELVGRVAAHSIRVQFESRLDQVETYPANSTEIDWSDVIAYQLINWSK